MNPNRNLIFLPAVGTCCVVVCLLMVMPILRYESLHSHFFDLGQYATYHFGIAFEGRWGDLFSTHAHPLALPYALIYRFFPSNVTLLMLQSTVVGFSALLFGIYWKQLDLPHPECGVLLYLLSFSTWFAALFEFHFEHLIFPIVFMFFLVLEREDVWSTRALALLLGLMLCLVKEVYPLSAAMLGFYLILVKRWNGVGLILVVGALIYFLVAIQVLIPRFSDAAEPGALWSSGFGHLGKSLGEITSTVFSNPFAILTEILSTPRKLLYALVLFGSMAFLPLGQPLVLLPALPILAISLLSRNENHYYLGHQYTVLVTAVLLVAVAKTLVCLDARRQRRALAAALVTAILVQISFGPSPISRLFWSSRIFSYHWSAYLANDHDRKLKQAIEEHVPHDNKIVVSMQNAINTDRLSNRSIALSFPDGIFEIPATAARTDSIPSADIVVLDRTRPLSFRDKICVYEPTKVCEDAGFLARYDEAIIRLRSSFNVLYDEAGILIARRRSR